MLLFTKRTFCILLSLFLSQPVFSQTARHGFYVVNAESKIPVPDALVQSSDQRFNAITDEAGFAPCRRRDLRPAPSKNIGIVDGEDRCTASTIST